VLVLDFSGINTTKQVFYTHSAMHLDRVRRSCLFLHLLALAHCQHVVFANYVVPEHYVVFLRSTYVVFIIFRVSRMDDAKCTLATRVCLSAVVFPHYCTGPDVTWGMVGGAPSCAPLGGFAISARVALL